MDVDLHKRKFTVQIDVVLGEKQAFMAPSFRYRFLDGSKKLTPAIGAVGWTPLASAENRSSNDTQNGAESSTSSLPSSHTVLPPPPANTLRCEHVFADVNVTEAFATALDDDPILSFFFADHVGLASGNTNGAAAASQTSFTSNKDSKGANSVAAATGSKSAASAALPSSTSDSGAGSVEPTPRAYAGLYELDVSSLLAGRLQLEQCWLEPGTHATPTVTLNSNTSDSSSSSEPWSPFKSKRKPAKLSQARASQSLVALLPPSQAAGLRYLAIRVCVDAPLLSDALTTKLNPLTITLESVRRLPGIASRTSNAAALPHAALQQHCRPIYASFQLFPDKLRAPVSSPSYSRGAGSGLTLPRRLVVSAGKPQNERADWHHAATFLTSRFHRAELLDALQFGALIVEVHDRDLVQVDRLNRLVSKWETLHTTGVDVTATSVSVDAHAASTEAKPLDIFAVDDVAKRDCYTLLLRAGESFPHGLATFRLDELLNTAKQLVGGGGDNSSNDTRQQQPFMVYKLTTDVVAAKRRAKPLGAGSASGDDGDDDPADSTDAFAVFDLTPTERLVREPGAYLASGTALSIHVALQHALNPVASNSSMHSTSLEVTAAATGASDASIPIPDDLAAPPRFSRMVLIIPYNDDQTLQQVARVMASVNGAALPNAPIRSYQLTASEKLACACGDLDVITGAQIIDSAFRTIILEGVADRGMQRVYEQLPRPAALNDPLGFRLFANAALRFPTRLYTAFEIDLKRIKLRFALPTLLQAPDIYMRSKVSETCYTALMRLADVRNARRLDELQRLDLFPTAAMLLEVESKYGESITLDDIDGSSSNQKSRSFSDTDDNGPETIGGSSNSVDKHSGAVATTAAASKRYTTTFKAPTDSTNDAFELLRKSRKDKDYLTERKKELEAVRSDYAEKKRLADLEQPAGAAPIYMYSGQKLRTQDALQDEMRKQLANDRTATFTYSHAFQSLAVSLVDVDALQQTEALGNRQRWTTQRGFVYPAPRDPSTYNKHKDAPSDARCEELREPFNEYANHPAPASRGTGGSDAVGSRHVAEFTTLPAKDTIFGGMNADGSVDPQYFRSVHLCGEGLRQEQDEALKREVADWERRLVIDKAQRTFLAHGNTTGVSRTQKPAQVDKLGDILKGPVRSKPLRIVQNATLPSGKRVPLAAPPVTIHNQQPYAGSTASQFAATLRATDATSALATTDSSDQKDFRFPSTTHELTPSVKQHVSRREIAPLAATEKRGLMWHNE